MFFGWLKNTVITKVREKSNILGMAREEEIQDILRLQAELIHHRAVWDPDPWLELNMSTPQLKALLLISRDEGIRMRELARKLGSSFSNATVLVDRLVDRSLVERLAEPQDRRVVLVWTTRKGRRLIERLVTSWRVLSTPLLETLTSEDLATVHKALRVLLEAAQKNQ
jgi:DNA-binding MarR family transcriptional regulator